MRASVPCRHTLGHTAGVHGRSSEYLRSVTWVIVEEVKSGDWGIGGNGLTTADVQALRGQAPAAVPG